MPPRWNPFPSAAAAPPQVEAGDRERALRAMKRALISADLDARGALALSAAVLVLERETTPAR